MTTQELHIDLDMYLQRINSHFNQNIEPQEKDLFLNREITRFINRRIDRLSNKKGAGLFDTIKRTVELSPLLKTVRLPVMYDTNNPKEGKVNLPLDYLLYINSEASVCCDCITQAQIQKTYYEVEIPSIKKKADLPIIFTQGLYSFGIVENMIPDDYLIEDSIPLYSNNILMINAIIMLFNKHNTLEIEMAYNKVKDVFIFRCSMPFNITYNVEGVATTTVGVLKSYNTYDDIDTPLISIVDPIDEEFLPHVKKSSLSGAKDEKALVQIRDKQLIYTFKGVISDYVFLTYLRKPKKIDLLLQCNSDLSDTTLEEVVADTAQRLLSVIGSDSYAKYVQENILTE